MSTTSKNKSGSSLPPDPLIGHTIADKYEIRKKLGEGGMGSVYIAHQLSVERDVALKVLLNKLAEDDVAVKRFEQEAKAVSRMQHPNTVTIYDYGQTTDGRLYIVMELLKGRTLSDLLRKEGQIEPSRASRIIQQVCASLQDAHAAGIIHRDLKPDNIFLTEVGGNKDWVKVLDFGVAKLANENAATLTQTGMIFGTPKYMSPEQAEGRQLDYRADIYALGVVFFEMLLGRPPFLADTPVALLLKHIQDPLPSFQQVRPDLEIPPELEAVVGKMLAKQPPDRYPDVQVLFRDLEHIVHVVMQPSTAQIPVVHRPRPSIDGRPMPTEVVPAQSGADLSPADLRPPRALPSGLSLGVGPKTEAAEAQSTRPSTMVSESATHAVPISQMATQPPPARDAALFATGTTPGITGPIGAGAYETLGGIGVDSIAPGNRQQTNWMAIGGLSLVVAAAAVVGVLALRGSSESAYPSRPIDSASIGTPSEVPDPPGPKPSDPIATDEPKDPPANAAAEPVEKPRRRVQRDTTPKAVKEVVVPKPERVELSFDSNPAGAIVIHRGAQIGKTPFARQFPKGDDVETFVFEKTGYQKSSQTVTLSRGRSVEAKLNKRTGSMVEVKVKPNLPDADKDDKKSDTSVLNDRVSDLK